MLRNATTNSRSVAAQILSSVVVGGAAGVAGSSAITSAGGAGGSATLSYDIATGFGDVLMGNGNGGNDAIITVYNPLAYNRTEMVVVQVGALATITTTTTTTTTATPHSRRHRHAETHADTYADTHNLHRPTSLAWNIGRERRQ
jgi:hypothetical protein